MYDPLDATSTAVYEAFLDGIFADSVDQILYVFGIIWPFLITIGVIVIFWRVGRAFFK